MSFVEYVQKFFEYENSIREIPVEKKVLEETIDEEKAYNEILNNAKNTYNEILKISAEAKQHKTKTFFLTFLKPFGPISRFLKLISPGIIVVLTISIAIWFFTLVLTNVDLVTQNFSSIMNFLNYFVLMPLIIIYGVLLGFYLIFRNSRDEKQRDKKIKEVLNESKKIVDEIIANKEIYIQNYQAENEKIIMSNKLKEQHNSFTTRKNNDLTEEQIYEELNKMQSNYPEYNFIFNYDNKKYELLRNAIEDGFTDAIEIKKYVATRYRDSIEKEEEYRKNQKLLENLKIENQRHEAKLGEMYDEQAAVLESQLYYDRLEAEKRRQESEKAEKKRFEEVKKQNEKLLAEAKKKNALLEDAKYAVKGIYYNIK